MSWQCSSCVTATCMYRFVCLETFYTSWNLLICCSWLAEENQVPWIHVGLVLFETFPIQNNQWRIINPPLFSFTVNSPGLTCCCWTGTGVTYQMAMYEKKEGISHHPITLSSRELRKWKWPSAGPRRAWRLLSSPPGHSLSTSPWAANGKVGGSQGTSVPPVNGSSSSVGMSTLLVAGGKCKALTAAAMGVWVREEWGKLLK